MSVPSQAHQLVAIRTTAIFYDGRSNFQLNYNGESQSVLREFRKDMKERGAVWGHLFSQKDGKQITTYAKEQE